MNTGTNLCEIQQETVIKTRHRCIHFGVSKNKSQLAEKWNFLQRVLKISNFGQNARGGTLFEIIEFGHFIGRISESKKIANTSRILALLVWLDPQFILVYNGTKISKNEPQLAENIFFPKGT